MMKILKNLITILVCVVVSEGIDYNSVKYNWDPYDIIKISKYTEPGMCYNTQKISTKYLGILKVNKSLELEIEDLLHCEVINPHLNVKKPRMIIYTVDSTSEPSSVTKFSNPTDKNCFSFSVKTSGVAYIYLYTHLNIFKYNMVALGINNTKSLLSDNHRTCSACRPVSTVDILDPLEFRAFWISWDDNTIEVGKEGENDTVLSNTFYEGIGKIQYIGIATTGSLGHSTWKIEEPYCPDVLSAPDKERTVLTKCNKIFDQNDENLKKYSDEIQVLKKVQALEAEYLVEKLETQMNLTRLKDYYYKNTEDFYFKNYIKLIKYCKSKCNEEVLNIIGTTIQNLRIVMQEQIEKLASIPECSKNGNFDDITKECICNNQYAGDGIHCGVDQDEDGYPDENILDCIDNPKCKKDNCPSMYNPDQEDQNNDGIGDICEFLMIPKNLSYSDRNQNKIDDEPKIYCADMINIIPTSGKDCIFEVDFLIPEEYREKNIILMFAQKDSQKTFIFSWGDNYFDRFKLDKLESSDDVLNVKYDELKNSEKLFPNSNRNSFEIGKNYRIILFYSFNKLQIRIVDVHGTILETSDMNIIEIDNSKSIEKICSISGRINWRNPNARCN